jgi:RimJ/RimL family protein N-acetyltransferase
MVAAVTSGKTIIAAVLFHNWDRSAGVVEISAASDSKRWLSRGVLLDLFRYAFHELGCQAVVARIDGNNRSLARIFTAYGFKRYDIPRLRGRDATETLFVLADDHWRRNGFHKDDDYEQTRSNPDPA